MHWPKALESLPQQIQRVLDSPTCLSSPFLAVLDSIQVAADALRLDATMYQKGRIKDPIPVSSALERERVEAPHEFEQPGEPCCGDLGGIGTWRVELAKDVAPKGSNVRTALLRADWRIKLTYDPKLSFGAYELAELSLWPCENFENTDVRTLVAAINLSLQEEAKLTRRATGSSRIKDIDGAFLDLQDNDETRQFLVDAFQVFDERLKDLLAVHLNRDQSDSEIVSGAIKNIFLNQFFWVTKRRERGNAGNDRATVAPIFLDDQQTLLREVAKEIAVPENDAHQVISNYALDSRSLFSAFPADTLLSVYVENWTNEKLTKDPPLPPEAKRLRAVFRDLTQAAHRRAADKAGLPPGKGDELNLFSVPVLIDEEPFFVAQMSLPVQLKTELRGVLANHIRALGGIMDLHAKLYQLWNEKSDFVQERMSAQQHSYVRRVVQKWVGTVPIHALNPLNQAKRTCQNGLCTIATNELKAVSNCIDGAINDARKVLKELGLETSELINLSETLDSALDAIPRWDAAKKRLHIQRPARKGYNVRGIRGRLEHWFREIAIHSAKAWSSSLTITITPRYDDEDFPRGSIEITFRDNRKELIGSKAVGPNSVGNLKWFEGHTPSLANLEADIGSMGGLVTLKPVSEGACLIVRLPFPD
jgi:hypothetical protein